MTDNTTRVFNFNNVCLWTDHQNNFNPPCASIAMNMENPHRVENRSSLWVPWVRFISGVWIRLVRPRCRCWVGSHSWCRVRPRCRLWIRAARAWHLIRHRIRSCGMCRIRSWWRWRIGTRGRCRIRSGGRCRIRSWGRYRIRSWWWRIGSWGDSRLRCWRFFGGEFWGIQTATCKLQTTKVKHI